jgi:ABC-type branched-subunit amino acid transport system ATPase component
VTPPLLSLRGVTRRLGGHEILTGVDLDVPSRSLVALVGPNGAGKTTLFEIMCGLVRPTAGSVRFDGREIIGLPPHRIARLGIGRTFQTARPFPDLAVLQNVLVGVTFGRGRLGPRERHARAERLTEIVGLHAKRTMRARTLSLGEQKRLELAMALALEPRLLLLDELASGLSPRGREEVIRFYGRLRERGLTVLAIEHSLGVLAELADRMVILHQGKVVAAGTPREVLGSPVVSEAYFGDEHTP